jgi:hypothetical protein
MESTELRRDDDVLEEMESCRALTEMGNSLACFQSCECGFPPREMAFPSHNYSALSKLNKQRCDKAILPFWCPKQFNAVVGKIAFC